MVHFKQLGGPERERQLCRGAWRTHRRDLSMAGSGLGGGWAWALVEHGPFCDGAAAAAAAAGGGDAAHAHQQRRRAGAADGVWVGGELRGRLVRELVRSVCGAQPKQVSGSVGGRNKLLDGRNELLVGAGL